MKLHIQDYERLFNHKGLRFLINDLALKGYADLGVVAIVQDDEFVCYMPKTLIEKTSDEGLVLYGNEKKFNKYTEDFREINKKFIAFCDKMLSEHTLLKSHMEKFFDFCIEFISEYKKTELIYVDKPYLESQKSNNQELKNNLKKYESVKFEFRDLINVIFFSSDSYYQKILEKLGKQLNVSSDDLQQYKSEEILALFEGKKVSKKIVVERFHRNVIIDDNKTIKYFWGKEADNIIKDFLKEEENQTISGIIVNKGKATGIARIIKPSWRGDFKAIKEAMECMNKGDILIAETTSPDIMIAIRKAGAIVADQGGLMSHAAIMSREMNVPGIVGAHNATKLIKDGDLIEVDADKGVVKIIKRSTNV